jgi:hypothetical protein
MRLIILIFLTINSYGQAPTKKQIDSHVKIVDSLLASKKLKKISYPQMSICGGALCGYYLNQKLVFIDATLGAEFGANTYKIYFKDTVIYKIRYEEYWGDQEKYAKKYPQDIEIDEKKLTYTDTLYTIYMTGKPTYVKSSGGKIISKIPNQKQIDDLIGCGQKMRDELETLKTNR